MILRRRAEEMVCLMQLTEREISSAKDKISGDVRIGAGESRAFHYLSRTAGYICQQYPDIRFHITSGDTDDLMDQLSNGLIDLALLFTDFDKSLYQYITLPQQDYFGVLMRRLNVVATYNLIYNASNHYYRRSDHLARLFGKSIRCFHLAVYVLFLM